MLNRFEEFVTGITECHRYIQRIKSMEMTELGLKGNHVMCLYYLARSPEGLTAAQLCALCCEDKAAISRTLAELENKGYLKNAEPGKKLRLRVRFAGWGMTLARCQVPTQALTASNGGEFRGFPQRNEKTHIPVVIPGVCAWFLIITYDGDR